MKLRFVVKQRSAIFCVETVNDDDILESGNFDNTQSSNLVTFDILIRCTTFSMVSDSHMQCLSLLKHFTK